MESKKITPVYLDCSIDQNGVETQEIMIQSFNECLTKHRSTLKCPHRHSFYHIVLFTEGKGSHSIDFINFQVKPLQIYFMVPGQVHSWDVNDDVEGYMINFSENFLASFLLNRQYLDHFFFLSGWGEHCVYDVPASHQQQLLEVIEKIYAESRHLQDNYLDMMRLLLLELFIFIGRLDDAGDKKDTQSKKLLILQFLKQVEQDYKTISLPKDYASLLYVTPNYLNALCNLEMGKSAGEIIRSRILLEARRLLMNPGLTVRQIAHQLHFTDNSYFNRFFKKASGLTPQKFRKSFTHQ